MAGTQKLPLTPDNECRMVEFFYCKHIVLYDLCSFFCAVDKRRCCVLLIFENFGALTLSSVFFSNENLLELCAALFCLSSFSHFMSHWNNEKIDTFVSLVDS